MWLEEWGQLSRIVVIGLPIYVILIALLRITGTRALSKNNAFDSVVSFALGSALAAAVITQELPGALALAAILLLLLLQFLLSWLAVRSRLVERLITSAPRLLLWRGEYRTDAMRAARLTPGAVRAAVRSRGAARLEDVFAVVLETDGSLSVIVDAPAASASALEGVEGLERG